MKKIITLVLVIIIITATVAPLSVSAADANEVMLIIQLHVDKEIGDKGSEIVLYIFEETTYEEYAISFYDTNNYRAKFVVPEGTYLVEGYYLSGTIKSYNFTTPTINAVGQTVNVDITIGNGDWDGTANESTLNGTIDRDKTNDLLEEDGENTIDWDKVDAEVSKIQSEIATPETGDETTSPDESTGEEITTPGPDETTTTPGDDTSEDTSMGDDTTTPPDENDKSSLVWTVVFVVVVLGGSLGFVAYKKHEENNL